jgi:hypothetical protein
MALASDTQVLIPGGGEKALGEIIKGDMVTAGGLDLQWSPGEVTFSTDTGETDERMVFLIIFVENEAKKTLIALPGQLFLMPDKRLKHVRDLNPGSFLTSSEGKPLPIIFISQGAYTGNLYMIGIGDEIVPPDLNGHLFVANGVVAADAYVEIQFNGQERQSGCLSFFLPFNSAIV